MLRFNSSSFCDRIEGAVVWVFLIRFPDSFAPVVLSFMGFRFFIDIAIAVPSSKFISYGCTAPLELLSVSHRLVEVLLIPQFRQDSSYRGINDGIPPELQSDETIHR